jgi:hypothetical protein
MSRNRQGVRKPATKFANLQKQLQRQQAEATRSQQSGQKQLKTRARQAGRSQ